MHPLVLDGAERHRDVVEAADAVPEPVEHRAEEPGPVVDRGRVQGDPGGDERRRCHERQAQPELRRQRRREREQGDPEPVRAVRARVLEPEPAERDHARPGTRRRRPFYPCALRGTGAAPSTAASESPRRMTATATPAGLKPQQLGLDLRRPRSEARRVDPDDADSLARERALDELGRERAGEPRRDHDRLHRPRGGPALARQQLDDRPRAVRLRLGEDRQRREPVTVERGDPDGRPNRRVDGEHRPPGVRRVRAQDRAGGAHLDVEAVLDHGARVRVENDRDLVARRVLELLHHQLAAARRRLPVHLPERLPLLVLAHRVEVEARRATQQQPPAVLGVGAALGEEPVELRRAAGRPGATRARRARRPCARARTGRRRSPAPPRRRSGRVARARARRCRGSRRRLGTSSSPARRNG